MAASTPIETREDLHYYLQVALQLEHATIPPYITALYSLRPGANLDASSMLRVVAIEEMLHLTLAANLLNAVDGCPNLKADDFIPDYPTYLPSGQDDFMVGLEKFSEDAVKTFLQVERPAERPEPDERYAVHEGIWFVKQKHLSKSRSGARRGLLPTFIMEDEHGEETHLHFHSIGEFYEAIRNGLCRLASELGECELFCGDPSKQVGPEYYYSGGGEIHVVTDLETAKDAIDLISGQGEGFAGGIYDNEAELSHFYRFQQIMLGKYYQEGDEPESPSGGPVNVDWDAVFPCKSNAKVADFQQSEELARAAKVFNAYYKQFLWLVHDAFNGQPERLIPAVGEMFNIREAAQGLIRNPIPGLPGTNAAPTFQMNEVIDLSSQSEN